MSWRWRPRRIIKPVGGELDAARRNLERGTDAWLRWWRQTGESELRCVLMTAWDPIGVRDAPEAWGEYDDYAPGVARLLRDAASRAEASASVAEYLNHVERDFMGVFTERSGRSNRDLAEALVAWHEWSFEGTRTPPP